jgi:hypothetical protein
MRAADRGVKVRIYLDGTQLGDRDLSKVFRDFAETPTVEIRTKHDHGAPMHLGREHRSGGGVQPATSPYTPIRCARTAARVGHYYFDNKTDLICLHFVLCL